MNSMMLRRSLAFLLIWSDLSIVMKIWNAPVIYGTFYGRQVKGKWYILFNTAVAKEARASESYFEVFDCHAPWLPYWATGKYEGFVLHVY